MPLTPGAGAPSQTALGAELLSVVARLNRMATRRADLPVPSAQARLLAQIEESGPSRICDLATADHCSQPTMTAQVQRLEAEGWVRRQTDRADARAVLVTITVDGRAALHQARERRAEVVAPYLAALAPEDLHVLAHAVDILQGLLADASSTHTPNDSNNQE